MKVHPGLLLLVCRILLGVSADDSLNTDTSTTSSSAHLPSTQEFSGNPSDTQKQDKTDAAQVKSYGMMPNYYQPGPAAIPVPLPIKIQGGPLMLPPGMQQAPYPQLQPLYPQPLYQPAGHKSDNPQQPVLVQVPNVDSPAQFQSFISEHHNLGGDSSSLESAEALSNHKSASLDIDVTLNNPSGNNLIDVGFNNLPSDHWPQPTAEMPKIVNLDVRCEKNLMRVSIEFDRPFNGIIYSKGHIRSPDCIHLSPGHGRQTATFDMEVNRCGVHGNSLTGLYGRDSSTGGGSYFENTIIIQYDPQVQEVWDQARRLRCSWHDQYEKPVTFRPFAVDMMDIVRADFAGDNVGCWMQIQAGKGPLASEVSGIVKIGQQMTMVLAIQDDEGKFDMLVRNCLAHDGKRPAIKLVDQYGCVVRPKIMSRFTKSKNFGQNASVLSYAHFQAFKFPDSMEVFFQCTIQICRHQCPEQCSERSELDLLGDTNVVAAQHSFGAGRPRDERDVSQNDVEEGEVGVKRVIQVVSTGDFSFPVDNATNSATVVYPAFQDESGYVCMSTPGFAATLILLLALLIIASLLCTFLCIRQHGFSRSGDSNLHFNPFSGFVKKSNR